jgi:hypothetical protein
MRAPFRLLLAGGLLVLAAFMLQQAGREPGQSARLWPGRDAHAHAPCAVPVHYALGEVEAGFGFDELTVSMALAEAAGLWQSLTDTLLFIESDHPRAMTVHLRFDARQRAANTRRSLRGGLERDRAVLEADEAELVQWNERIESNRAAHERAGEALAQRARAHEAAVRAWNENPAQRSEARRRTLEAEGATLGQALEELERAGRDLNSDIDAYNRRAAELRRRSEDFRLRVSRYNEASSAEPVESGRYSYDRESGRRIEVFRAESYDDLVWVLAHELGHALGIGHVDEPGAVMHAMLHDDHAAHAAGKPVMLGAADHAALLAVCGRKL